MRKFKNFPLVRNKSKLYSETKDSHIFTRVDNNEQGKLLLRPGKHILFATAEDEKIFTRTSIMRNKFEDEIEKQNIMTYVEKFKKNPKKKTYIMYRHLVQIDIFTTLTRIQDEFILNNILNEQLLKKNVEGVSLVPWSFNLREFIQFKSQSPYISYDDWHVNTKDSINSVNNETLKLSSVSTTGNFGNLVKDRIHYDDVHTYASKSSLSSKEIFKKAQDSMVVPSRHYATLEMSRNCRSCPAVIEIRRFSSKFSSKRNESKVLVLSSRNFEKFEKTFTILLAKNKIRTVKPLFKHLTNCDQVLTKLERALINHNLRIKNNNNNIIKKNVIILQSEVIENIQSDLNEDLKETIVRKNRSTFNLENMNSRISNRNIGRTKKQSNIMIVNDEIFKKPLGDGLDKNSSTNTEERKCNLLYLNNEIFKELKEDEVKKILKTKYTYLENKKIATSVGIRTKCNSKRLKPTNSIGEENKEYEVPIDHLIAAVAEKKRLEYVQRSRLSWQVFEKSDETLRKAEILNFPSIQNQLGENCEHTGTKGIENFALPHTTILHDSIIRSKQKEARIEFSGECRSERVDELQDVSLDRKTNMEKAESETILKQKAQEESPKTLINESKKNKTLLKKKEKNEMKTKNRTKTEMKMPTHQRTNIRRATQEKSLKKKSEVTPPIEKKDKYSGKTETQVSTTTKQKKGIKSNTIDSKINTDSKNSVKQEIVQLKSLLQMENYSRKKKIVPGKDNGKFTKQKKYNTSSLKKQQKCSLKEKGNSSIEVLHKSIMKSPLSSSQSEFITDLIEKPKKKVKKAFNSIDKLSRKKIDSNSKDLADETETKLIVEELLTSSRPPKHNKNSQHLDKKVRSKLPIIGTPTTIRKQIEKVAIMALTTREIREKFNIAKVPEEISELKNEKMSNGKKEKVVEIESEIEFSNGKVKELHQSEKTNVDRTESEKIENPDDFESTTIVEIKKNGKEVGRLQEDEVLSLNSNSILGKINEKITKTNELKKKKKNGEAKVVPRKNSYETKTSDNIEEEDADITHKSSMEKLNDKMKSQLKVPSSQNLKSKKIKDRENKEILGKESLNNSSESGREEHNRRNESNVKEGIEQRKISKCIVGTEFKRNEKKYFTEKWGGKNIVTIINDEKRDRTMNDFDVNMRTVMRKERKSDISIEESELQNDKLSGTQIFPTEHNIGSGKKNKNLEDISYILNDIQDKFAKQKGVDKPEGQVNRIIVHDEMKYENFELEKISPTNNEMIRMKRLLYFGDKMQRYNKSEFERIKETSDMKQEKTIFKKGIKTDEATEIENKFQTKLAIEKKIEHFRPYSNHIFGNELLIEGERHRDKKKPYSQYTIQTDTEVIEKGEERKINCRDAVSVMTHESEFREEKTTGNPKISNNSESDNVIVIKEAGRNSKEKLENVQNVTESFMKRVHSNIELVMENPKRHKEIASKLRRAKDEFELNLPASLYGICQGVKKLKNKISNTKIMMKKSREYINKFTNTNTTQTIVSAVRAKLKETKRLLYKHENKVKSVIEHKTKLFRKSTGTKLKTQMKNVCFVKPKREKEKISCGVVEKRKEVYCSPTISISDIPNRSIGSLFADTVASALANCGDVNIIMSKYSDSLDKLSSPRTIDQNMDGSLEKLKTSIHHEDNEVFQKKGEFLMDDEVEKLILNLTLEKNKENTDGNEWKCCSKAVLVKKSIRFGEFRTLSEKSVQPNQQPKSADVNVECNVCSPIPYASSEHEILQKDQWKISENIGTSFSNMTMTNQDIEANASQKTEPSRIKLKISLETETDKSTLKNTSNPNEYEKIMVENKETSGLKYSKQETDFSKSVEELDRYHLTSDKTIRTAEGSVANSPLLIDEEYNPTDKEISNEKKPANIQTNDGSKKHCSDLENINEEHKHTSVVKESSSMEGISFNNNSSMNSKQIEVTQKYLKSCEDELQKETALQSSVIPKTSTFIITNNSDVLKSESTTGLRFSEMLSLFNEHMKLSIPEKTSGDKSDHLEQDINCKNSIDLHSDKRQGNLTRKDEIERSCKLSNHLNSLVCREKRKGKVSTVMEQCDFLDQTVPDVLKDKNKVENSKEIFMDLERMGNCILRTVFSTDKVSNEECIEPKLLALKNCTRTITTRNSCEGSSRFGDWKSGKPKKEMPVRDDSEILNDIRDEAIENEVFFETESMKKQKVNYKETEYKPGIGKHQTKRSVYHEIIRMSEHNDVDRIISKEKAYNNLKQHAPATDLEGYQSGISEELELKNNISLADDNRAVMIASSQLRIPKDSSTSKSENSIKEPEKTCCTDALIEKVVFEVNAGRNSIECNEKTNDGHNDEKNEVFMFEPADKSKLSLCDNHKKSKDENAGSEKSEGAREKGMTPIGKTVGKLNENRQHKILEKFAMIRRQPDHSVFKISNAVMFDRSKKRICQPEKVVQRPKKDMSREKCLERYKENIGNKRMCLHLSPSKELLANHTSTKNSDTDLKKLLLQNPRKLMQIASKIMSKNQYLNFLLDLKSTKDLKEYWMNKLREGFISSKNFCDSKKIVSKVGKFEEGELNEIIKHKKTDTVDKTMEIRPTTKQSLDNLSLKSDADIRENSRRFELDKDNLKPATSKPGLKQQNILSREKRHDENSSRNISFQTGYACEYPDYGTLRSTSVKHLEMAVHNKQINVGKAEKKLSLNQLNSCETSNGRKIQNIQDEKRNNKNGDGIKSRERKVSSKEDVKCEKNIRNIFYKRINPIRADEVNPEYDMTSYPNSKSKYEENKTIENYLSDEEKEYQEHVCRALVESEIMKTCEDDKSEEKNTDDDHDIKRTQQTAIVLPGRQPMKISLISEGVSGSPACSMKDVFEKGALENLSDVLSDCSGPVSSKCREDPSRRISRKPDFDRMYTSEILQRNSPSSASSSGNTFRNTSPAYKTNNLNSKKFENPLKMFVSDHDEIYPSKMIDQLSNRKNIDISRESLNEERKISVLKTKSLSEVLKEDPNLFKKLRQRTMVDVKQDLTVEPTRRFEYRFHDFRNKGNKCEETETKRQEEHKNDISAKFKCLVQARKVASERNRQNTRPNENQQIHPRVFSKILEKINYFKESEIQQYVENKVETVDSHQSSVPTKRAQSSKANYKNQKLLSTKRKQINEDELVTWVQDHPADQVKRMATENVGECGVEKQNVIHIPWMPTCEVDAKN